MIRELRTIDVTKFDNDCNNPAEGFEFLRMVQLTNHGFSNVAKFYSNNSQNFIYGVTGDSEIVKSLFSEYGDVYNEFGIYDMNALHGVIQHSASTIAFIHNNESVHQDLEAFHGTYGAVPTSAVILDIQVMEIANLVRKELPNIHILNRMEEQEQEQEYTRNLRPQNAHLYDIADDIIKINAATIEAMTEQRALAACRLLDKLESLPPDPLRVFCANGVSGANKEAYLALAVVLTYHGFNCEIPSDEFQRFMGKLNSIYSRQNMLLNDYLQKMAYPPSVAVYYSPSNVGYLCTLEDDSPEQFHDFKIQVTETTLDKDWKFMNSVKTVIYKYSELEERIIDPVTYFHLDSITPVEELMSNGQTERHSLGMKSYRELAQLLTSFEELVFDESFSDVSVSANCTNLLFYSDLYDNDKFHIALVTQLPQTAYAYRCQQLCGDSKPFVRVFSRDKFDRLLDVCIVDASKLLLQMVRATNSRIVREHFMKPRFLRGYLLQMYKTGTNKVDDFFGAPNDTEMAKLQLTPADVGMWSGQTTNGRGAGLSFMLYRFDRFVLHKRRYLSFWGGNHPMDLTSMIFDTEIWGGKL